MSKRLQFAFRRGAIPLVVIIIFCAVLYLRESIKTDQTRAAKETSASSSENTKKETVRSSKPVQGDFQVNDAFELPFLGVVRCHARQERVSFKSGARQLEWPFKVYYLPNGMFVRAEFNKPGATDFEQEPARLKAHYRTRVESLIGFPEKAAPASLGKVLQSLYENEPFDTATKINITWVLREDANRRIRPWFIANIFGVSPGLMRVPNDNEAFLKYRILLTPEGEAVWTDNLL